MKVVFWIVFGYMVLTGYITLVVYGLTLITNNQAMIILGGSTFTLLTLILIGFIVFTIELITNQHRRKIRERNFMYHSWLCRLGLLQTAGLTDKKGKNDICWFTSGV